MSTNKDNNINLAIRTELVGILYRNLPINIIGMMVVAPILFWELTGVEENQYLMMWYVSLCVVVISRYILLIWYRRTRGSPSLLNVQYHLFVAGSSLTACLWGILGSFMVPQDPVYQYLIFLIIVGIVSGAVMSLHASYYACVNYIVFGFFPMLIWLALHILFGQYAYTGLLLAGITYTLFVTIDAYRGYAILVNNLKLNFENQNLNTRLNNYNSQLVQQAEDLKQRQSMIETLTDIGEFLPTSITEDEVYSIFSRFVGRLLPECSGALAVFVNSRKQLQNVAVWGPQSMVKNHTFLPTDCWALRRGQPFRTSADSRYVSCSHLEVAEKHESICIPMMAAGETLGVLSIIYSNARLIHEHQGIINRLIGDVAMALANVRLRKSLENLSIHDSLTNLYNRRYLEDRLMRLIPKIRRKNSTLSFFMFDVDYFKHINDQFGHDAGDAVLRELGIVIKGFFRESDLCFRYGGEEFMVILEDSTKENTMSRAEAFREVVKNLRVPTANSQVIMNITISGGVSTFPEHGETMESVIVAADKAMYKAKNDGRDCVRLAG